MERVTLSSINQYVSATVNPADTPEDLFELYSVPSYENQYPEIVKGKEIGSTKAVVQEGDVLICKINPKINRVWVVKHNTEYPLLASSEWIVVRNSAINSNYLKWYFMSPFFRKLLTSQVAGIGGSLTRAQPKQVAKYPVPIVELEKQGKIVNLLEKVNFVISVRQQQLAKLDELVKARFVEMFICKDNPMVTLDSLTLGKSEYGAQSASAEYDSNRPRYIRITDINDDGTLNNDIVSSANIKDDQRYKLTYGDFLFARMGATVGKTYAYKSGDQIFAGYLIRYKLNLQKIMPEYLFAYTKLEKYKKWVLLNQSGAAQPGINAKKYGSLQIPLAPLEEQRAFTNFVRQTDKSRLLIRKSLEQMETLKKALMQQYFG